MSLPHHYPPELLQLIADAVAKLCRSKRDVLVFFEGAGVPRILLDSHERVLKEDEAQFKKGIVSKAVLVHLNRREDTYIKERREIIKRVVEWENFESCWPDDQARAKTLVEEIRRVVGVKDAFTRMELERQREAEERRAGIRAERTRKAERAEALQLIRRDLTELYGMTDPVKRGIALESVLNRIFAHYGVLVSEAFQRRDSDGKSLEQIDGVVQVDYHFWLVEVKWHKDLLGPEHINAHLGRVFGRGDVRAMFISASSYTVAAIDAAKSANVHCPCVLIELAEIVDCLNREVDLIQVLNAKIKEAILHKNPLCRPLTYLG